MASDSESSSDSEKLISDFTSKHRIKQYSEYTTIRSLKKVLHGKSYIRRFCWLLFFLTVTIGFLQGIINAIILYCTVPTATTVYTDPVNSLIFPSVTICNINGYNFTYLEESDLMDIIDAAVYSDETDCSYLASPEHFSEHESLFDTVNKSSQSIDNLIQDCHFLGEKCVSSMFSDYITPTGRCLVFNGGSGRKEYLSVNGNGLRHNLELVLNVESDTFAGSVKSEVGALVSVHSPNTSGLVWETGIHVPIGHSAYLAVTNRQIEDRTGRMVGQAKLESIPEGESFKYFTEFNYSSRACHSDCNYAHIAANCSCNWINGNASRHCHMSDLCCIYHVLKTTSDCNNCSKLCNHTEYEVTPNYSTFPSPKSIKEMEQKYSVSREKILNNFLKVNVYYKSLSVDRVITERSFTLNELFAQIGGHLGLYLGASMVSIVELLVLVIDLLKDRFKISEKRLKFYWLTKCKGKRIKRSKNPTSGQRHGIIINKNVDLTVPLKS